MTENEKWKVDSSTSRSTMRNGNSWKPWKIPPMSAFQKKRKEAKQMAKECLDGVLSVMLDRRDPLPEAKTKADPKRGSMRSRSRRSFPSRCSLSPSAAKRRNGRQQTKWVCTFRRTSGWKTPTPTFPSVCWNASPGISARSLKCGLCSGAFRILSDFHSLLVNAGEYFCRLW